MEYAWIPNMSIPINHIIVYREWVDELEYLIRLVVSSDSKDKTYAICELLNHVKTIKGV